MQLLRTPQGEAVLQEGGTGQSWVTVTQGPACQNGGKQQAVSQGEEPPGLSAPQQSSFVVLYLLQVHKGHSVVGESPNSQAWVTEILRVAPAPLPASSHPQSPHIGQLRSPSLQLHTAHRCWAAFGLPAPPSCKPHRGRRSLLSRAYPWQMLSKCQRNVGRKTQPAPGTARLAPASGPLTQSLNFSPPVPPAYTLISPALAGAP